MLPVGSLSLRGREGFTLIGTVGEYTNNGKNRLSTKSKKPEKKRRAHPTGH